MKKNNLNQKGLHSLEYMVVICLVALGIILMRNYMYRSVSAHFKLWQDGAQDSLSENYTYPEAYPIATPIRTWFFKDSTGSGIGVWYYIGTVSLIQTYGCPFIYPGRPDDYATWSCFPHTWCSGNGEDYDHVWANDVNTFTLAQWNQVVNIGCVTASFLFGGPTESKCFNEPGDYYVWFETWPWPPCPHRACIARVVP